MTTQIDRSARPLIDGETQLPTDDAGVIRLEFMLKRLPPKKLQLTSATIRILSRDEQKQVVGGLSVGCSDIDCPMSGRTCSKTPLCQ